MNDFQIHSKITSVEVDVLKAVRQRTLETFTEGPSIERARLFFLLLPFFDGNKWTQEMEDSAKTVSIVYAALHAHDQVKENSPISKEQQLTVLAGDFYSGIYYQMLSNMKNIKLIQQLATGIIRVSEKKASFYEVQPLSIAGIEESADVIETELLSIFYSHYGFDKYLPLAKLVLNYSGYLYQLDLLRSGEQTNILRLLDNSLRYPLYAERWLLDKLETLYDQIGKASAGFPISFELKNFMLHQITPHQQIAEQLTREG